MLYIGVHMEPPYIGVYRPIWLYIGCIWGPIYGVYMGVYRVPSRAPSRGSIWTPSGPPHIGYLLWRPPLYACFRRAPSNNISYNTRARVYNPYVTPQRTPYEPQIAQYRAQYGSIYGVQYGSNIGANIGRHI